MAKPNEKDLHQKIEDLNHQMDNLADILNLMINKMDRIEEATFRMKGDLNNELDEFRDETDISNGET